MKKKVYATDGRKPMMCGGDTKRQKKSYGGSVRKKYATGTQQSAVTSDTVDTTMGADRAPDREKLQRRRGQLLKLIDDPKYSAEVKEEARQTLMQIEADLGMSPTPGRANVDR